MKMDETGAFSQHCDCRSRLTKVCAGAAREQKGGRGGQVRLLGLKYKLVCHFKLAADMVGDMVASGSL